MRIDLCGNSWDDIKKWISNAYNDVVGWFDYIGESLKPFKNKDGSYSLYDNDRYEDDTPLHEQILVLSGSFINADVSSANWGLGSLSIDAMTGGWEFGNVDLSLLDVGHVEISASAGFDGFSIGAMASVWSPSVAFEVFGIKVAFSAELFSIGAYVNATSNRFSAGLSGGYGGSIVVEW